jgi:uncharacterized protein DUF3800
VQDALLEVGFFETLLDYVKGEVFLIQAYFDESERPDGLFCVAGYAFASEQARKFNKEWDALFGAYGGLHMKEFAHGRKHFAETTPEQRDFMMREAVKIINSRMTVGVAVSCRLHEMREYSPAFIKGFGSAYSVCCHWVMNSVCMALDKAGIKEPIAYVFEAGHPHEKEARHFVRKMNELPEIKAFYRHHSDSFLPKNDAVPLQAADLLAYEWLKFKDETLDKDKRKIRANLLALFQHAPGRYLIAHVEGETLRKGMERYRNIGYEQVAEQAIAKIMRFKQ